MTAFDDTKTWHKSITGAVAAGDPVRLRLVLPRSFGVFRCALRLQADGKEADTIPMEWESTDDRDEWWGKEISLPCGLYFYWFEFETGWGVTVLKKQASSRCAAVDGTELWQLTVYDAAFQTPDCFKGGVIYQIFPDRFFASGKPKTGVPQDRVLHTDLHDLPVYKPDAEGKITNNDYFGGDLEGIRQKLPYIAGLGADILYLNPIFEAHSNHRYNTANYLKIDPLLGTEADFAALCKTAHGLGVKVILDGVFSHTGDDSIYFNKYGRYPAPGAWQRAGSPYDSWYRFRADGSYDCWWDIDTLPEVDEEDPAFTAFITGEGGVIDKWLSLGADGFRLDVADELPDAFLDAVRTAVKRNGEEKLLLGEVWEDASNKISHGGRRRYFDGRQLDGVMNYPFRNAVLRFALTGDAPRFMDAVYSVVLNYPPQAMNVCMNLLGSHDTQRILTALTGVNVDRLSRGEQADLRYTPAQLAHAKKLLKLANIVNYALPGIPSLFYGDEAGMLGAKDPFNRAFFPWGEEDTDLQDFFRLLGKIRKDHDVLQDGGFYPLSATLGCIAFLRYAPGKRRLAVISNKNPDEIRYVLNTDMRDMACIYGGTKDGDAVIIPSETAVILTD